MICVKSGFNTNFWQFDMSNNILFFRNHLNHVYNTVSEEEFWIVLVHVK